MAAAHIGPSVHMDPTFWTPVRLYEKVDRTGDFKQYLEEYGVGLVPASSLFREISGGNTIVIDVHW